MHLIADAVELAFHWLNPAGSQAKLFEKRCDLSLAPAYLFQDVLSFTLAQAWEGLLEQILVLY